jgi:hypothetical protein
MAKTYKTKYGTFYDELNEDDIKFFEMTDEEFDERANKLSKKVLNGVRDAEVIEADARYYRNKELLFGKTTAKYMKIIEDKIFKIKK